MQSEIVQTALNDLTLQLDFLKSARLRLTRAQKLRIKKYIEQSKIISQDSRESQESQDKFDNQNRAFFRDIENMIRTPSIFYPDSYYIGSELFGDQSRYREARLIFERGTVKIMAMTTRKTGQNEDSYLESSLDLSTDTFSGYSLEHAVQKTSLPELNDAIKSPEVYVAEYLDKLGVRDHCNNSEYVPAL